MMGMMKIVASRALGSYMVRVTMMLGMAQA